MGHTSQRPTDPFWTRARLRRQAARIRDEGQRIRGRQRGATVGALEQLLTRYPEQRRTEYRHALTKFLFDCEHSSDLDDAEVIALSRWAQFHTSGGAWELDGQSIIEAEMIIDMIIQMDAAPQRGQLSFFGDDNDG